VALRSRRRRRVRSRRDPGLDKRALSREIDADLRRKDRQKLADLRAALRAARGRRKHLTHESKSACRHDRQAAIARAKELRRRALEAARAVRVAARTRCSSSAGESQALKTEIERLRAELRAEEHHQQSLRRIVRGSRAKRPSVHKAAVYRGESDDEVRHNIPSDLVPLFNRLRRSIRGSARRSRTEEFLEYVEAHPNEQYEDIDDKTDSLVRELERQQRAGRRDPRMSRRMRRYHRA
jgi:hypothetical protein